MDDVPLEKIGDFEAALLAYMESSHGELMQQINETGDYNDEIETAFTKAMEDFKANHVW
jgi:F-type H+-transporting ATPase subunit alpha